MRTIAVALLLACAAVAARAQAWIGTSSGVIETASIGDDRWVPVAKLPAALKAGMHVRAGGGASATVVFSDHSRLRLAGGSELVVDEIGPKGFDLKLQEGSVEAFAERAPKPRLRLRTPTAYLSAAGAEYSVEISPLRDTQVVVYDGAATVRLQNGETAELGPEKDHRSLLVIAGRPLRLLPHPREDGSKRPASAAAPKVEREWPDCLHGKNGALRGDIEEVAACQRGQRARLAKTGDLTLDDSAELRAHQQEELREFARAHGWLTAASEGEAAAADDGDTASAVSVDGSGTVGGAYLGGIDESLAKSLRGMGFDPTGGGADARLSAQDQALLQQLRTAGPGGGAGGQVSPAMLNALFQALLGGPVGGTPKASAPKSAAPAPADDR
ncbi:MAG: FecR domain-containing protein [Elusimicrobia bacterium]|nr:FecR domain-containing protein [Elusimicrobiota bacterium]